MRRTKPPTPRSKPTTKSPTPRSRFPTALTIPPNMPAPLLSSSPYAHATGTRPQRQATAVALPQPGYKHLEGGVQVKTAAITFGRAAVERLSGDRPSTLRALAAATITGGATAAVTYRLLRSKSDE